MNWIDFLPIIAALAVYILRMKELRARRDVIKGPVQENWTLRLFILIGLVMLAGSIGEYFLLREADFSLLPFLLGALLAVVSFVIRRKAIAALGRFWSLHVEIREEHQFVRSGPFRWMRHPTYFSMILELLAVGFFCRAWWMCVLIFILFVPVLMWRVRLEERALVEKFGDQYRDYQKSTPAFIPYRPPLPR